MLAWCDDPCSDKVDAHLSCEMYSENHLYDRHEEGTGCGQFCHFAHPELVLRFVFASVFCGVFLGKKMRQSAVQKMLSFPFRIVSFGVFLCVAHFA